MFCLHRGKKLCSTLPCGLKVLTDEGPKERGMPFSVSMRHAFVPFPGNDLVLHCLVSFH